MTGRDGIEAYLHLLDEAFRGRGIEAGDESQAFIHDAYHAGQINHLRSLLGPDDRWRHVQEGFG